MADAARFIFMVYLVAVALLGFELRWGIWKMAGVMLAGCVPFLSFWVEHVVHGQSLAQIEAAEAGDKVSA